MNFMTVRNDKRKLWVNFYGTVALLGNNEVEFWKKNGFEFTECDLKWNEISYGIN